jgi:hypothetical protein
MLHLGERLALETHSGNAQSAGLFYLLEHGQAWPHATMFTTNL